MSRVLHPFRLKAKRWSGYQSNLGIGFEYPIDMIATYEDYSWAGRPVRGSPYDEIPLFWTPHQAARTLNLSLEDYYSKGYCLVPPSKNGPVARPRAIIYGAFIDVTADTLYDVVGDAITPIADTLTAAGIWAGRAYPWQYAFTTAEDDFSRLGPVFEKTAISFSPPWTSFVDIDDVVDGNTVSLPVRALSGSPYEAGDIMYVIAMPSYSTAIYVLEYDDSGNTVFGTLNNRYFADMEYIQQVAALHDRAYWYLATVGDPADGPTDLNTGLTRYQYNKDVNLPGIKGLLGDLFDYSTIDATLPTDGASRTLLANNIRSAILAHFDL